MELGRIGVWMPKGVDPAVATEIETLGYGAVWLGGSPSVEQARPFVEATQRIPIATGIMNVWQHDPAAVALAHAQLEADHPGRFLLGIGAGHPENTSEWKHPMQAMQGFLDGLDAATTPVPKHQRVAAALGPKMLALSAARTLGAHPYFVPSEHTAFAREQLGADPLLAPEVSLAIDDDMDVARDRARRFAANYLFKQNYANNLRRFGFEDHDFEDGGSDSLLDAVVPHGPLARVVAGVQAHLDAGADHVCVQPVGVKDDILPDLRALAAAMLPA